MKTTEPPPHEQTKSGEPARANTDDERPPANTGSPPSAYDAPAEPLSLKVRHRASFYQARDTIVAQYGVSPVPDELMRLWLASATPWQIVRVFEEGILNITGSDLAGTDDDQFMLCL